MKSSEQRVPPRGSSYVSGFARFVAGLVVSGLALVGMTVVYGQPAGATTTAIQFNLQGWGTASSGNNGRLASVNLVNAWMNSYGLPLSVSLNEICWNSNSSSTDQYDFLAANVILPRSFIGGLGVEDLNADPGLWDLCAAGGIAVLGHANSVTAQFAPQSWPPGGKYVAQEGIHARLWTCIYPTIWIVNYVVCGTHLSTKLATADAQLSEAQIPFAWEAGHNAHPTYFSGDFNIDPQYQSSASIGTWYYGPIGGQIYAYEADFYASHWYRTHPVPPSSTSSDNRKIDYIFGSGGLTKSGGTTIVSATQSSSGIYAGPFPGKPVSDHYLLTGSF